MRRAFPLVLLLLSAAPFAMAAATDHPVRVTTDSSAYCTELAVRLAKQGQRLCESGHVRSGIAKLRRALRATQAGG